MVAGAVAIQEAAIFLASKPEKEKTVRKNFTNWFNLFFSPKEPTIDSLSTFISESSITSSVSSDVETQDLNFSKSSRPKKGILKPAKQVDDLSSLPPPIKKSAFLRTEEIMRLTALAQPDPEYAMDIDEQPAKKSRLRWAEQERELQDTWSPCEYNRGGNDYIAKHLNPAIALAIKKELNEVKMEMEVHAESAHYTQFYAIK